MKKRNKEEVLSGQRIKIAALLTGISLLLLSGCGNKAQEAEGSQVQTDIAVTATEQTATAEEQAETVDPETLDYAYRLHITINPEFRVYLDEQSKVVPVTEPESARNARVVQHLVSVVEDPCGRPAVPVEVVADRPVPDVAAAVWMLPAEPAAGIVEAVVEIPASSAVEAVVSLVVSVMARV